MTKLVLDTNQIPSLVGKVSGELLKLTLHAVVESAHVSEGGYTHVTLDVKGGNVETEETRI